MGNQLRSQHWFWFELNDYFGVSLDLLSKVGRHALRWVMHLKAHLEIHKEFLLDDTSNNSNSKFTAVYCGEHFFSRYRQEIILLSLRCEFLILFLCELMIILN